MIIKKKEIYFIIVAVLGEVRIEENTVGKRTNYHDLQIKVECLWKNKSVVITDHDWSPQSDT